MAIRSRRVPNDLVGRHRHAAVHEKELARDHNVEKLRLDLCWPSNMEALAMSTALRGRVPAERAQRRVRASCPTATETQMPDQAEHQTNAFRARQGEPEASPRLVTRRGRIEAREPTASARKRPAQANRDQAAARQRHHICGCGGWTRRGVL